MKQFWFDEFERMTRMYKDLLESPATRLMRDMEQQRQLLEPPGHRALIDWQEKQIEESRRINQSLTAGFSNIVAQYDALKALSATELRSNFATEMQRSLRAFQPPALPVIESFTSGLLRASRNLDALENFEQTFAGQLLGLARKVSDAPEEEIEGRVHDLTHLIGSQMAQAKHGPISIEAWVQIILAVLLYINGMLSDANSEHRAMKRLDDIQEQLKAIAPLEKVERVPELRLVAANVLRVRSAASGDAAVVGKLTRNSLVRLLGEHKTWAHIEYFDFIEGKTREGWVSKRHLRELPEDFTRADETPAREAEFERAATRVLEKNAELYRRLS